MDGYRRFSPLGVGAAIVGAVLLTVAYLALRTSSIDTGRVYKIGFNQNPPFQMLGADGQPRGFAVDVVSSAARRSHLKLQWIFDRTLSAEALRNGTVDLWPLLADLPERHQFAHISDPWMVSDNYLIARGATTGLPPEVFGGTIHYSGPDFYMTLLRKRWPNVHLQSFPEPMELSAPFCRGQFPFLFLSVHQANILLREIAVSCPAEKIQVYDLSDLTVRLGVASKRPTAAVADRLRAEILQMGEDGELGGILGRYAYVGLSEVRMIIQLVAAERQARMLRVTFVGLWAALAVLAWLGWHLVRMRRIAEQANIAKSEFLANASSGFCLQCCN